MDDETKAFAYIMSDSFTNPELFEIACIDMAERCSISQAAAGSAIVASYGRMLWNDKALNDYLKDYVDSKFKDYEED